MLQLFRKKKLPAQNPPSQPESPSTPVIAPQQEGPVIHPVPFAIEDRAQVTAVPVATEPTIDWGKRIESINDQLKIQASAGNWNYNDYMLGMFNGMECVVATIEGREPKYRSKPEDGFISEKLPDEAKPKEQAPKEPEPVAVVEPGPQLLVEEIPPSVIEPTPSPVLAPVHAIPHAHIKSQTYSAS